MSARNNLAEILGQWLQLTKAESVAIQKSRWPDLKKLQARKAALQEALAQAARQRGAQDPADDPAALQIFGRIKSLLTRNAIALAAKMGQARNHQGALEQTKRNLQRIQGSYAKPAQRVLLRSYS